MSIKQILIEKIQNKQSTQAVIGLGYVGLPLAVELAKQGLKVVGIDVDARKVDAINSGISYIPDVATEEVKQLVEQGFLSATTDFSILKEADTVNICVPTPLGKTREPDLSYVIAAVDAIADYLHDGLLIILESTTYPGTTEEIVVPRITKNNYVIGEQIFIAFSPERIDPGNKNFGVHNTPKLVGGVTPNCTELAIALYSHAIHHVVPVSSPTAAEMAKLLENTFRAVNIGLVNEVALMCDRLGIDAWEVIDAAATKPFGFMAFYPGPGLGGHCIPVDPHYLSWKLKTLNYNSRFIELASDINTNMPHYVVDKVTDALNQVEKSVRNSTVLILGVAYKRDIDDVRESPALDVINLLRKKGALVTYHDPYVAKIRLDEDGRDILETSEYSQQALSQADCVVVITDHSTYDWQEIVNHSRVIVDTRHATANVDGDAIRIWL